MKPKPALFDAAWVHCFEEDGPEGEVFRPETHALRPSRRPRRRVSFSRDGSARVVVSGPDDRLHEIDARWSEQDGAITVSAGASRAAAGGSKPAFEPMQFTLASDARLLRRR